VLSAAVQTATIVINVKLHNINKTVTSSHEGDCTSP